MTTRHRDVREDGAHVTSIRGLRHGRRLSLEVAPAIEDAPEDGGPVDAWGEVVIWAPTGEAIARVATDGMSSLRDLAWALRVAADDIDRVLAPVHRAPVPCVAHPDGCPEACPVRVAQAARA